MQVALDLFDANIRRSQGLTDIFRAMDSQTTGALDLTDILRAALVMSVSALDHFIHEIVRLGMLEAYRAERVRTAAFLRFQVSLESIIEATSGLVPETRLESQIRERHGYQPIRIIQWYLETVHQLHLSVGAIVQAVHGVARQAETAVREVLEQVRASPVVQGDETGWRQDGSNGYVWTFSTPSERYFLRRGRDKGVVDEVLDSSFSGGLVSDFYAAYNHYPGLKQRCWAHLLRDIHDLKGLYPEDAGLAQWAEAVHQVYTEAKASVLPRAQPGHRTQLMLEEKLMVLARPFLKDPLAVQAKLCRRMERFIKELFVFVSDPAVPSDNNAAERSLRHLVTSRKISGGTRSGQGTDSKMTLASLFGTWRARGLNPLLECRRLLTSPQL